MAWYGDPIQPLRLDFSPQRLAKGAIRKTATSNSYFSGKARDKPKKRGTTPLAEMAHIVAISLCIVKRVLVCFPRFLNHACLVPVGRDSKRTSGASFTVRAMANIVLRRLPSNGN